MNIFKKNRKATVYKIEPVYPDEIDNTDKLTTIITNCRLNRDRAEEIYNKARNIDNDEIRRFAFELLLDEEKNIEELMKLKGE